MGDSSKLNALLIDTLHGVLVGIGGGGAGLLFRARGVVRGDEFFRYNQIGEIYIYTTYLLICVKSEMDFKCRRIHSN